MLDGMTSLIPKTSLIGMVRALLKSSLRLLADIASCNSNLGTDMVFIGAPHALPILKESFVSPWVSKVHARRKPIAQEDSRKLSSNESNSILSAANGK